MTESLWVLRVPRWFSVNLFLRFDSADCVMVTNRPNYCPTWLQVKFYRKCHYPAELRTLRQVHRRLGKLWSQSSYLKCFKVLCRILGGVGKSYSGHVMYFCFLQRYKSKWDKIKLTILKLTGLLFASCCVLKQFYVMTVSQHMQYL